MAWHWGHNASLTVRNVGPVWSIAKIKWSTLVHKPGDFDGDLSVLSPCWMGCDKSSCRHCSRRYLKICHLDRQRSLCRHSRFPDNQCLNDFVPWLFLEHHCTDKIFRHFLDGMPLNLVTYVPLWLKGNNFSDPPPHTLFVLCHYQVKEFFSLNFGV